MKIANAKEMRRIDERAQKRFSIPVSLLMEDAGAAVAQWIFEHCDLKKNLSLLAGSGNNAGDGFVAARSLIEKGYPSSKMNVFLLKSPEHFKGMAQKNFSKLQALGVPVHQLLGPEHLNKCTTLLKQTDLFIDAVFGLGLSSTVSGIMAKAFNRINDLKRPIVAVDIPSGISADDGRVLGVALRATATVTFGLPKLGHYLGEGIDYRGTLIVNPISFPKTLLKDHHINTTLVTQTEVKKILKPRPRSAHKGTAGHLLVIAGSPGKTGAALMTCMGALRSGAGLVTLLTPRECHPVLGTYIKEVMIEDLPAPHELLQFLSGKKAVAIGPGIGVTQKSKELLEVLFKMSRIPIVIDADAVTCLSHMKLKRFRVPVILTPHPGEMGRLVGKNSVYIQNNRLDMTRKTARKLRAYIVLKGAGTIIASPQGEAFINSTGNPAMATAGMGDVLTGVIASLIGQGYAPLEACLLGVFIHGHAGDRVAARLGDRGMIASDVIKELPKAIGSLLLKP